MICFLAKDSVSQISGLDTNVNFLLDLASHPSFQAADVHTGFIDQHFNTLFPTINITNQTVTQAIAAILTNERNAEIQYSRQNSTNSFSASDSFRVNSTAVREIEVQANETKYTAQVKYVESDYEIKIDDSHWVPCTIRTIKDSNSNRFTLKLNLNGIQSTYSAVIASGRIDIFNEVCFINLLFCEFSLRDFHIFFLIYRMEKRNSA